MKVNVTVTQTGKNVNAINAAIADLKNDAVFVGIPEAKADRKRKLIGPQKQAYVTNAGLLYIHTNGSQLKHIPARPVIEPAINANRLRIESLLMLAAQARLNGNKAEFNRYIKMKPRSRAAKRTWLNARTIVNLVPQYMPTYGTTALDSINTPLIDTAQLRRAITYVTKTP
jgi:hypothetical protein